MLRPWPLNIDLNIENKSVPMYQALANEVQRLIENGSLKEGDALPGSREMAEHLKVSRKTVVTAMTLLVRNGWLENRDRVGLFVRANEGLQISVAVPSSSPQCQGQIKKCQVITGGSSDIQLLPCAELSRTYRQFFNLAVKHNMMGYGDPRGNLHFRQFIALGLRHGRCLCANSEEIIITRGAQQAFYLVAHALLKPGDAVVMEWPTYHNAVNAFKSAGLELIFVDVDGEGICVDKIAEEYAKHPNIRAIYVTPRQQYPTTVGMSYSRRTELVDLVTKLDLLVIEDDFDSYVQYTSMLPLSSMLPKGKYIYIATSSKLLAPTLRVGFAASDIDSINAMVEYRKLIDMQGDAIMERALATLVESGEIRRLIRKSQKIYKERLDYISRRINTDLKDRVSYKRPSGGLSIWIEMKEDPGPLLQSKGIEAMIFALPAGKYGLRIGYASMSQEMVDLLISALKG